MTFPSPPSAFCPPSSVFGLLLLRPATLIALIVAWVAGSLPAARAEVFLNPGATVLFYGNSMVERLGEQGELEAWIQLAFPEKKLHFRSLAWTGDEVGYRLRPEGYEEHLKSLLKQWPANVVVIGYGMNEAFDGTAGLGGFRDQLDAHLDQLERQHPGAKFVLLSPTPTEPGVAGQDAAARNRDIAAYAQVISDAARARGALYVDLAAGNAAAQARYGSPFTENGLHLNEAGNRAVARIIARAMIGDEALARVNAARVPEVAKAVRRKSYYVAEVVRPKNADLYYGVRKRPEENAAEIPRYHQMIAVTEAVIHQLAASSTQAFDDIPAPWLPPLAPIAGHDDGKATGVIQSPGEQWSGFTVAPGYAVNLFASEVEFPELKNPVQIAFDARGRLWVVTMPSFPHTVQGLPPEDRLLVLEDTDHDGRADRCTTFAQGLDALDGVAFSPSGVIVSEQPKLWLMTDVDGDGRADTQRELLRGIDVTDSHHGGMIATDPIGDVIFCDGVFHRSQIETPYGVVRGIDATTYRLNPRTGRVETEWQSITPNPWKVTYDRTGNLFQMYGDGLVLDTLPLTWTPLGIYHPFAYAQTIGYGKGSAAASVSSPNFPDEYQQGMASAALLGSYVVSLTRFDFSQGMVRGSGRLDLMSSTNAAFRPADLAFGFDGALYVSDFSSVIIGHAQHPMRDPHWDHTHGRIWRVVSTNRPVVKEFPRIEGAGTAELLALLQHPQDIVRHHVRIELLKSGTAMLPALDAWAAVLDRTQPGFDQAALEVLFVTAGLEQTRPQLLEEVLKSRSPLHRAAGVRMVRLQADRLTDPAAMLSRMATDPHPRVQMEVVDAIAHLRPRFPAVEHALHGLHSDNADVRHMLEDLRYGTVPAKGRSVPVLEFAPTSRITQWLWTGTNSGTAALPVNTLAPDAPTPGSGLYRTYIRSEFPQSAVLAVHHGYLDIEVNGVQLLSFDSMWSNDQQVQLSLNAGLNVIDIQFRKVRAAAPEVYLFSPMGRPIRGGSLAADSAALLALASEAGKQREGQGEPVRIQAVPGRMQFSPRELKVKAGAPVHLVFENPDLMLHNLLILAPGSAEEIGALADVMATEPSALQRGYIPDSKKVLHATPLVQPKRSAELRFTAPTEPGDYPILCTFPGHWRMMRGTLVVE